MSRSICAPCALFENGTAAPPRHLRAGRTGFSFVEVLIAVLLIGLILVPILWFMTVSHRNTRSTINEVIASNLASEFMESIRALPFGTIRRVDGEIVMASGPDMAVVDLVFGEAKKAGFKVNIPVFPPGWKCALKIDDLAVSQAPLTGLPLPVVEKAKRAAGMFSVFVRVTWNEGGLEQNLDLLTALGRY